MSFFDEDIKRSIWEGKIPIIFTLSPDDLTSHLPPAPFALMAARNTYFPLITNIVKDYFSSSTLVLHEMWLEYKGIPLKWHVPIGVLFDTLVSPGATMVGGTEQQATYWNITVHFQSYPERLLMKCLNEESVKTYYRNVLKEAYYIKHGDINKINNLNINQSNELWDGLRLHDYDKFWSINKLFYNNNNNNSNSSSSNNNNAGGGYKYIPIRIIYHYKPPIQELIPSIDENGQELTLENLFYRIPFATLSNLFTNTSTSTTSPTISPTSSSSSLISIHQAQEQLHQQQQQSGFLNILQYLKSTPSVKYKIQGIEPPLDSTLSWLSEYFSHPDNFLYIVLSDSSFSIQSILNSLNSSNSQQSTSNITSP
ncbi:autophagy protein 5 [Tieghemostelium lacteum]|uniref:Autophagy protein 5 n=1 Tax=Tieghemostelium lacteum TaxID=361077 RepID=A0A151ZE53_TIELA|nr:autophagy protein 5 [Tieghemostelium lacteum]|eukprot:KYQ92238.1 autophagy protein 5 [Tieghemostelium lacteum]